MVYEIRDRSALLGGGDGLVFPASDGGDPTCAKIFLHGLGSNTADWDTYIPKIRGCAVYSWYRKRLLCA